MHEQKIFRGLAWILGSIGVISDLISQTEHRSILPDYIEQGAGNLGIPFLTTVILCTIADAFDKVSGKENKWKLISLAFMLGVVIGVEGQFIKEPKLLLENIQDMAFGLAAIGMGAIASGSITASFWKADK